MCAALAVRTNLKVSIELLLPRDHFSFIGMDKQGFGFGGTGKKSNGKQFDSYGEAFGLHDVVGCLLDLDDMTISWRCVVQGHDLEHTHHVHMYSHAHNVFYNLMFLEPPFLA
jgi:hypothetical protein